MIFWEDGKQGRNWELEKIQLVSRNHCEEMKAPLARRVLSACPSSNPGWPRALVGSERATVLLGYLPASPGARSGLGGSPPR